MARLPVPGGDVGSWGDILNGYLEVSLNGDGTIQSSALQQAGAVLTSTSLGGDLSGTLPNPTVARVNGISISGSPSSGQVLTALSSSAASWSSIAGTTDWLNAKSYGAKGNGITDDTAALTSWINAINAASTGIGAFLPAGQYMVSSALPSITNNGVTITGDGWAQTNYTYGSTISAAVGMTSTILTLAGEGISLRGMTLDGGGRATPILIITGQHCRLRDMQVRGVSSGGVCVDVRSGAVSTWIDTCVISGLNGLNTGVQINDTDAIITNNKPQNNGYGIVLLSGASGTVITSNHITPGSSGLNCIWINGNPSHVLISANRFDNYGASAVQITPPSSTPSDITISNNDFQSTVITDNTYAQVAVDTTNAGVRNLKIIGNTGYASGTNRPAYGVAAQTQSGSVPSNTSLLASTGSTVSGNSWWVATSLFGNANPSVALNNLISTNGTAWTQATDIYNFPAASGSTTHTLYKQTTASITPSATSGTFGSSVALSPDSTYIGILPVAIDIVTTGLGSETLTVQSTVTWNDSTTSQNSIGITTNATTNVSASQMISIMLGGDGKYATQISWAAKSSINSSGASATVSVFGVNQS
ncbi:MAG TPA: glycosyl hydrolase family 28-related protein [Candidatus Saccharimonadales bacterium]|nr:glycosyl hydrolase family 28-related protein [Candidatus Saccharimonadales bacterium]